MSHGSSAARYNDARRLTKESRFEDALQLLEKLERDAPDSVEVCRETAFCLEQLGRLEDALKYYQRLGQLVTSRFQISSNYGNIGRVKGKMGLKHEALGFLERAISLNEENRPALQLHAMMCNETAQPEREVKSRVLIDALNAATNTSRLSNQRALAEAYVQMKKWPEAAREYKKFAESGSPKDMREYASALQKAERFAESADAWNKVARFTDSDHAVFVALASK